MAKRITPEFEPTRIVQPVASPVETFVQPVLVQPAAPTGGMQVAQALSSLSSSLSGLGEELLLERRQEDLAAGAMEDLSNFTPQQLRDYEEKAGGILPWRYQAALQAYGMNTARANYETKAFESLNFQAEPYNADGTPRTYEQVQQDLNKMWEESTKGLTGHYAKMGAMQVRAEVDNERQLEDRVVLAMQNGMNPFEALGEIAGAQENIYALGWGSAREVIMRGIGRYINSTLQTADSGTNFEELRAVIQSVIDDGFGGPVSETFKLGLEQSLKQIEEVERNVELRDLDRTNAMGTRYKGIAADLGATEITNDTVANSGSVRNYSLEQLTDMATRKLTEAGLSPDDPLFKQVLGPTVNLLRAQVNALRTQIQSDPEALKRAIAMVESGDPNSNAILQQMLEDGSLDWSDYSRLNATANETTSFARDLGSGWSSNLMDGVLEPEQYYPKDIYQNLTGALGNYEALALSEITAKLTELRKTNPQDFATKARAVIAETKKKYAEQFQTDYKQVLQEENLINGLENFLNNNREQINAAMDVVFPKPEGGLSMSREEFTARAKGQAYIEQLIEGAYRDPALAGLSRTERDRVITRRLDTILAAGLADLDQPTEVTAPTTEDPAKPPESPYVSALPEQARRDVGAAYAQPDPSTPGITSGQGRAIIEATAAVRTNAIARLRALFDTQARTGAGTLAVQEGFVDNRRFIPTLMGIQDSEKAASELNLLYPDVRSPERSRAIQSIGGRLGVDDQVTKQYFVDLALAGSIGTPEINSGYTPDGVSLVILFQKGLADPLTQPMFRNLAELEAEIDKPQSESAVSKIATWSGKSEEEVLRAQLDLMAYYRRTETNATE
jgi:hypothetical protein